ncbi:MAG: hypothetical protein R3A44_38950 [Caldilineaceae bacterium]
MNLTQIGSDIKTHAGLICQEEKDQLIAYGKTHITGDKKLHLEKIITLAKILDDLCIIDDLHHYASELSRLLLPQAAVAIYVHEQWNIDIPNVTPEDIILALSICENPVNTNS